MSRASTLLRLCGIAVGVITLLGALDAIFCTIGGALAIGWLMKACLGCANAITANLDVRRCPHKPY